MTPRNPLDLAKALRPALPPEGQGRDHKPAIHRKPGDRHDDRHRHPREGFWWGLVIGLVLIVALVPSCAALDLSEQDKQAHLIGGALAGYVIDDALERAGGGRKPWQRRLASVLAVAAIAVTYEACVGYADPDDALATTIGGVIGVGTRATVHLIISPRDESVAVRLAVDL